MRAELQRILGEYSPNRTPQVYSPIVTDTRWPEVTAAHEATHFRLVNSTAYGLFFVCAVDGRLELKQRNKVVNLILSGQWLTQEATATYVGLGVLAAKADLAEFDHALSLLPSAVLGQPPYREAFGILDAVIPLADNPDLATLQAKALLVETIATWALSGDVLDQVKRDTHVDVTRLEGYLMQSSPDIRFQRLMSEINKKDLSRILVDRLKVRILSRKTSEGLTDSEFWSEVDQLHDILPSDAYLSRRDRSTALATALALYGEHDITPLPAVSVPLFGLYGSHYQELDHLAINCGVDPDHFSRHRQDRLLLSILFCSTERMWFRTTTYTATDKSNPVSISEALFWFSYRPAVVYRCTMERGQQLVASLPLTPSAVCFHGHAITHWRASCIPDTLSGSVTICLEPSLSEIQLLTLLAALKMFETRQYFLINVNEDADVACFFDPECPNNYLVQLIDKKYGTVIFQQIARDHQLNIVKPAASKSLVPHLELIGFAAQLLIIDVRYANRIPQGIQILK